MAQEVNIKIQQDWRTKDVNFILQLVLQTWEMNVSNSSTFFALCQRRLTFRSALGYIHGRAHSDLLKEIPLAMALSRFSLATKSRWIARMLLRTFRLLGRASWYSRFSSFSFSLPSSSSPLPNLVLSSSRTHSRCCMYRSAASAMALRKWCICLSKLTLSAEASVGVPKYLFVQHWKTKRSTSSTSQHVRAIKTRTM